MATSIAGPRRRRLAVIAGAIAVIVLAGAVTWFRVLPAYRPALHDGERFGVDVSNHQHEIDWPRVHRDGMTFAYIKATEGGDYVDERFRANWDGAGAAGLDRGAYHFFTLCRPGAEQADNFLAVVPHDPGTLPPVVDLELGGNCTGRPDRSWLVHELDVFVDRVESATGRTIVVYVLDDIDDIYHLRDGLDRPQWRLGVLRRPGTDDWWMWQVNGQAHVDGIDGAADLDVMRDGAPPRESDGSDPRSRPH